MLSLRFRNFLPVIFSLTAAMGFAVSANAQDPAAAGPSVDDYSSIQEAIDKNPGKMIYVPPGKYEISKAIKITTDNTGLFGFGEIIQNDPTERIISVENASGVRIKDITVRRPEREKLDSLASAIFGKHANNLILDGVQVFDNKTSGCALRIEYCDHSQIRNCLVQNYTGIALDDRRKNPGSGYAFMAIVGTGISSRSSRGVLIQGNRIVEHDLIPTQEIKEKYKLGDFVFMNEKKGNIVSQKIWDKKYANNWHQGSAIEFEFADEEPMDKVSEYGQILGNYIENAAQGIDMHGDYVITANNIVNDCFMGAKTIHGSKNVIIAGNQFSKVALWGIDVSPGAFSTQAREAGGGKPAKEANVQAGTIIANNIISDVGYGKSAWIWKDNDVTVGIQGICLEKAQLPGLFPSTDIVIEGNVVYDPGRDGVLTEEGKVKIEPPRYRYAVFADPEGPRNVHFQNNIFHPGYEGVSNTEIAP